MKALQKFRIFFVDNDTTIRTLMGGYLTHLGCPAVVTLPNVATCMDRLTEKPQVVFLGQTGQGLARLEAVKKIKRFDPDIHVVIIAGRDSIETAIDARRCGAFDYIIEGEDVLNQVACVMDRIIAVQEILGRTREPMWKKILSYV